MLRLLAVALWLAVVGCGSPDDPQEAPPVPDAPLRVYATSYPLAYFAERIGGDAVAVVYPVPPGVDPAHWSPGPGEVADAQGADLVLRHGAGDPAWLDRVSLDRRRVVDATAAARDRRLPQARIRHQHGPEGAHDHGALAGTTWLDLDLAGIQAAAIAAAFTRQRPARSESFETNLATLRDAVDDLDREWAAAATALVDVRVLFSHPVYAYFQARYGVRGESLVWEPDAVPDEAEWSALAERLAGASAALMVWEATPLPEVAQRLAALGVESRVLAPAAWAPGDGEGDWLAQMRANTGALRPVAATPADGAGP